MNNTENTPEARICPHCGCTLLRYSCIECRGNGYWWQQSSRFEWEPCTCDSCDGSGQVTRCPNLHCPGKVSYPAHIPGFKDLFR